MQKVVAVLGGGIGGLSACHHLSKSPNVSKIVLLERSGRCGGWLSSIRRDDGAVFEQGPRGVRPAGAVGRNTLNMVSELGLESEILPVTKDHVASKNRFLYVKGQLHKMPSGPGGVVRTIPPFSRPIIQSVLKEILIRKGTEEDESVHAFVSRRLGSELANIAIDSLCRGVFAGDSRQLSVRSCFPLLYEAERSRGSIVLGMLMGSGKSTEGPVESVFLSFLHYATIFTHCSLPSQHTLIESRFYSNFCVFFFKPELASVLPPAAQPLLEELRAIALVTVAVVNLEYEGFILPVTGFGHLVPSSEDPGLLGVVYDSVPFPQHNRSGGLTTRLTVMMGGAWFEQTFGHPDSVTKQTLLDRATQAVTSHLGVNSQPVWSYVGLLKNCIPQYHLGHWKRLEKMRQYISNHNLPLTLAGASYDGVSVNDVIFSGRTAAEGLIGKT
uniref:Protoporphyrinogen oxidase n=1 Tax=Cyprinus carpio TaxID=7962 RepID=A0A8C1MKM9_CYPCA